MASSRIAIGSLPAHCSASASVRAGGLTKPSCSGRACSRSTASRKAGVTGQTWRSGDAAMIAMMPAPHRESRMRIISLNANGIRSAATKGVFEWLRQQKADVVRTALGWDAFDNEGRYVEARFGKLSVVSLYVPSGTSGDERQQFKFKAMDWLATILDEWLHSGRDYVLCGDWNIVRSEKDIKNWKSNQKNSGCLPEERSWLNGLVERG